MFCQQKDNSIQTDTQEILVTHGLRLLSHGVLEVVLLFTHMLNAEELT